MTGQIDPRVLAVSGYYSMNFWSDKYLVMQTFFILFLFLSIFLFFCRYLYRFFFQVKKSPQQEALDRLERFLHISCKTRDEYKRLYYDLTHVIKWYVERTVFVSLLSLTDDEAILCIKAKLKDDEVMQDIKSIFQNALGVKYAQHHTLQEQMQQDIQKAIMCVKKITPEIHEKK